MARRRMLSRIAPFFVAPLSLVTPCHAHEDSLSPVEVRARAQDLEGIATTGSEGIVTSDRLRATPLLRPGEILETVPGLIVTQHAGDGKANQYFLRGFNLDHGTDFATWVGGVPVNMPSHAHGQGYTDLNFLIPELVERIHFRKGPYFASEGDFSSAGSAHLDLFRRVDHPLAQLTLGQRGHVRTLLAGSPQVGHGNLLYGLELFHNDGPWQVRENYRRVNGVLRYSQGTRFDGFSITGMAYQGRWVSTDQLAQRAIDGGLLDRFGSLDPSTGGNSARYSLAADWARRGQHSQTRARAWWLKSGLDLWSNFQYCLNDYAATGTCASGDQFMQSERRQAAGFGVSHQRFGQWLGREISNTIGIDGRIDRLSPVGLYRTDRRAVLDIVREDRVTQRSLSLWAQNEVRWAPWFRTVQGVRGETYDFRVDSGTPQNSGRTGAHMLSPKLSLILGPWRHTEFYLNYGHGFHSNDARGTTIRVNPQEPSRAVDPVNPLVRTRGREIGVRTEIVKGWQSTLSYWELGTASELLFIGDAGITEASRPSRRRGVEWTNFYAPNDWLAFDVDLSWSHARFRDSSPEGQFIPGAIATAANLGITVDHHGRWFGGLRLRYFGPRPLVEDNSVRSGASALANLRVGYRLSAHTSLSLDVYNLFDRRVNDIEYWYDSQLRNETVPVFDRHVHPAEPRTLRLTLSHRF